MAKSSGIGQDVLPLPSGGGSARSIDESFKTDLGTGTGFYSVPIKLPRGVNNFTPNLSLKYSTGKGNGAFGMGWSVDIPAIQISMDRRLPSFSDSDIFLFEGRELVPMGDDIYRPVVENEFSLIKKNGDSWQVNTKSGVVLKYGSTADSKAVVNNNGTAKTWAWLLNEMTDINGNSIAYLYEHDSGLFYLKQINYAIYRALFQYEQRPDAFSSYRSGFEIRTTRRCKSVDIQLTQPAIDPVKSYRLTYAQAPHSNISLLKKVGLVAQHKEDNVVEEIPLPAIEFDYNSFDFTSRKLESFTHAGSSPPPSLLRQDISLLDLDGTGLQGVFELSNGTARFWPNKGNLTWAQPRTLNDIPLHADLSDDNLLFADMEGNGTADLMQGGHQSSGFYPNAPGGGFARKVQYRQSPNVPFGSPQTKLLDLDGDNRVDLLYSDRNSLFCYFNKGAAGWQERPSVVRTENLPEVDFSDPHLRVADIVGDGRSHLVQIHSGRVLYWPNLGNGEWGKAKRMENAPKLPRNYKPERLFVADIDGSGAQDILYVDFDKIFCWINQSGNSFSDPIIIYGTPPVAEAGIVIADMKGSGTNGVLWSYEDGLRNKTAYRFLDITGGIKPYLLNHIKNTAGVTTDIKHGSSTQFQKDKTDPALTGNYFLPFPVSVVKTMEVKDPATNVTSISEFKYYNGHFDGRSRQFLGFAKAERIELGDDSIPANRSVSYFHNMDASLKGLPYRSMVFGDDGSAEAGLPYKTEEIEYNVKKVATAPDGTDINFIEKRSVSARTYERTNEFNEVKKLCTYDAFGNIIEERKESKWKTDQGTFDTKTFITTTTYAKNDAKWLMAFKSREVQTDADTNGVLQATIFYYDGPDYQGLAEGKLDKGNVIRERQFVMTVAAYNQLYGQLPADLPSLGYVRMNAAELGDALFVDRIRQKLDSSGNPMQRKNPLGLDTIFTFDAHHLYPTKIEFSNGLSIQSAYEYKYGGIVSYKDQNEVETKYEYDKAGQLTGVYRHDDPAGQPYLQYEYDHFNIPCSQTTLTRSEKGGVQHRRVEYLDGLGEKLQVRSEAEDGKIIVTGKKVFNAKGLMRREHEPYFSNSLSFGVSDQVNPNIATSHAYDALGRSINRTDWSGNQYQTRFGLSFRSFYDSQDLDSTAGNIHFDTPKTEWLDAEDKLVAIDERRKNSSYITRYEYDAAGRRTKITINDSVFADNSFDALGRCVESKFRDAGTCIVLHDALNNVVQRQDGKGDIVYNVYDSMGRLKEVRYGGNAGTLVEEYEYDSGDAGELNTKGKLMKVKGEFGEVKFSYSRCGCLKSKTRKFPGLQQSLKVEYDQDNLKHFKKIKYPDNSEVEILYNRGGLIDSIPGYIDKIEYGATGRRTKVDYANGVSTQYKYLDGNLWLKSIKTIAPDGATTYQHLSYSHSSTGLINKITDSATAAGHTTHTIEYFYDELDQLTRAIVKTANGTQVQNYQYDDLGNVQRYPEQFSADLIEHNDNQHPFRITGVSNQPALKYEYDAGGNIIKMPAVQLEYNARNQLVKLTHDNGTVIEYLYDHLGSRVVTKTTANGNTETLFNFDDIYNIRGNEETRFVFDENSQLAMVREDNSGVIFHKDHLGSHVAESDLQNGQLLKEQAYYAFGKVSFSTGLNASYNFSGKKYDAMPDLVFFGGRYYVPSIGRFLTPDPYFLEQQPDKFFKAPRSLQLYCYVLNNPVNMIDPFGLWFGIDDLIVAAVGFVAGVVGYLINWAVSGGNFSLSDMLFSGLVGAASLWFGYNTFGLGFAIVSGIAMLAAPAITGGLDKASMGDSFGERFLGFLSFAIKFARSPITSTIGLAIGFIGIIFSGGGVEWFKGGVIAFEHEASSSSFSAVTLGASVNIWQGSTSNALFEHELYHSRQYTYLGDWFIPGWVVGGVYGWISSAAAGNFQVSCFSSASPNGGYGNPLESGAHSASRGGGCT